MGSCVDCVACLDFRIRLDSGVRAYNVEKQTQVDVEHTNHEKVMGLSGLCYFPVFSI